MTQQNTALFLASAALLLIAGAVGCPTNGLVTQTVSDSQAKIAQSDVPDNMLALLTALRASTGPIPSLVARNGPAALPLKNDVAVSKASFCSAKSLPSLAHPTAGGTLQASDVQGGVSGSCAYTAQVDDTASATAIAAVLDCQDMKISDPLDGGGTQETTLNGKLGFEGTLTKSGDTASGAIEASADGLTLQIDNMAACVAGVNMSLDTTLDPSAGDSVQASGCLQICKQFFSFSGTE